MFEAAELHHQMSREDFDERLPELRRALLDAQRRLADSDCAVVIVIAGAEGGGKGETVNTLLEWLDARGVEAHAFGKPTAEEAERPPLYRFWSRLPPRGQIGVFFGSWYTAPIVERSFDRIDEATFDRDLERIVDFERMLVAENVILVKLWMHISKKRQHKVLRRLEKDPTTAWRVTSRDKKYHETYDTFVEVSSRALRRTDTGHAPWHVVAARDKRHRHFTAGTLLVDAIENRLDEPRPVDAAPREALPVPSPVNVINSLDLGESLSRDVYEERLAKAQGRLGSLARQMTRSKRSAVLLFEGSDAAGKGGCIRRVVQSIDARYRWVVPIAAPTDEERARPYLWRFWRRLPGRGRFTIYDRSWYGRVLVERIEGLCSTEAWQRAYAEINAFEQQLVENGIGLFKFWLSISPEEQLRRFEAREATAYKQYKITDEDWRNREKSLAYEAAACEMIDRTSTDIAPWHLVPAEDKLYARVTVLETLCDGLENLLDRGSGRGSKRSRRRRPRSS